MRFFCQLVLVGDHRSQFQLQQNAGEDAAGIVMHDDAVVIAVLEQLTRPPERFEFGTEILVRCIASRSRAAVTKPSS